MIRERTHGEKKAYLQGYIAGLSYAKGRPPETVRHVISLQKQWLRMLDEQTAETQEQNTKSS